MPECQRDVVERGEMFEQGMRLKHESHSTAQRPKPGLGGDWSRAQGEPVHDDLPCVERLKGRDDAKDGGFSNAGRAHQRDDLATRDCERESADEFARVVANIEAVDRQEGAQEDRPPQRRSRRRANRERGSDIARYTIAHNNPGTTQLPTLVA